MEAEYSRYVGMMYERGYYVQSYDIYTMSDEVSCFGNKILITPMISEEDKFVYIFTGIVQKRIVLSDITEFSLYLEDEKGEFKDNDNIMLSVSKFNDTPISLFTRSYAQWKFGVQFDKGIHMDSDRFLIFQAQKEITKFGIEINNIDLFVYKHKRRKEDLSNEMTWVD
jgi:hypothetical protein